MEPPLPQNGSSVQCAKHPSQLSTGVCSHCLMERLSTVNSAPPPPPPPPNPSSNMPTTSSHSCEIEEVRSIAASPEQTAIKSPEVKMRKTLLLLFQLDDERDKFARSRNESNGEKMFRSGDEEPKLKGGKGASFRLSSIVPKWRKRESIKSNHTEDYDKRVPLDQSESKHSFRYPFDLPRHSWDGGGSIGKAMACPFACLEERKSRRKRGNGGNGEETMSETLENNGKLNNTSVQILERSLSESGKYREKNMSISRGYSRRFRRPIIKTNVNANNVPSAINGDSDAKSESKPDNNNNNNPIPVDGRRRREMGFRSRSVHYQSPGNLDNNGLLRFYLTPLRCSRSVNKNRRRGSRFFAGGLFGFF